MKYVLYIVIAAALLLIGRKSAQYTFNRYTGRIEPVRIIAVRKTKLVLFGDSHISRGKWVTMLGTSDLQNEGYGGHTSSRILKRLKNTLNLSPDKVVVCVGINDAYGKVLTQDYIRGMDVILSEITHVGADVYLCKVFYTAKDYYNSDSINLLVAGYNKALDSLATMHDAVIIDINPSIAPDGLLLPQYTYDGIHLNDAGYKIWAEELKKHF